MTSRYAQFDRSFNGYRLFVGDIGERVGKYDLESEFDQFGPLIDIWVARNPPGFAYVVYKHREDAEEAVRRLNGRHVCGKQVRVEFARLYPGPPPKINYVPRDSDSHRSRSRSPRRKSRSRSPRRKSPSRSPQRRSRSRDRRHRRSGEKPRKSPTPENKEQSRSGERRQSHGSPREVGVGFTRGPE